jgi:hypothetical protein
MVLLLLLGLVAVSSVSDALSMEGGLGSRRGTGSIRDGSATAVQPTPVEADEANEGRAGDSSTSTSIAR